MKGVLFPVLWSVDLEGVPGKMVRVKPNERMTQLQDETYRRYQETETCLGALNWGMYLSDIDSYHG